MATLQDYYNTGFDAFHNATSTTWLAQTFTAANNYSISSVKLYLGDNGSPGTLTISIKATDVNGKPTGDDLASGTTDGDTLDFPYEWREITFSSATTLSSGTQYAIVVRATGSSVSWGEDSSSPTYSGGTWCRSTDSGLTWSTSSSIDFMFECWGTVVDFLDFDTTNIVTIRRLVAVAQNTIYYENI